MVLPPPVFLNDPVPAPPVQMANVAELDFEDDNPTEFSEPFFETEDLGDGRAVHATAPKIRRVDPQGPRFDSRESSIVPTAAAHATRGSTGALPLLRVATSLRR